MKMQRVDGREAEVARRVRLTDDQIRRARAAQMYRMRAEGLATREIARFFSFSPGFVNCEIRSISEPARRLDRIGASPAG